MDRKAIRGRASPLVPRAGGPAAYPLKMQLYDAVPGA